MSAAASASASASAPAIIVDWVVKEFPLGGGSVRILHGIEVAVRTNELTYLVGESGSGKTTLISIVAGILAPTSGGVRVFGTDLYVLSDSRLVKFRLATIGFIFQQYNLLPTLTAAENAAVPLIAAGVKRSEAVERAAGQAQHRRSSGQISAAAVGRSAAAGRDRSRAGSRTPAGRVRRADRRARH